jgi:hypothetical protein
MPPAARQATQDNADQLLPSLVSPVVDALYPKDALVRSIGVEEAGVIDPNAGLSGGLACVVDVDVSDDLSVDFRDDAQHFALLRLMARTTREATAVAAAASPRPPQRHM